MISRDPDLNAWAGHPDARPCSKPLSDCWTRDPLDGGPLAPVLDRLAIRRGYPVVRSALLAWLSEPGSPGGARGLEA